MGMISAAISSLLRPSPAYYFVSSLFLRLLGVIYLVAFFSLATQLTGLVGAEGILPFNELLERVYSQHGSAAWWQLPNLFWIDSSDLSLMAVAIGACIMSLMMVFGYAPTWLRVALFFSYLSLFHAGQTFLSFQWDSLLLETGFLAIFLTRHPSALLLFLFHWLLFRLRFMSGAAKLATGDPVWANLTSLQFYFETQPLPHWGAWYFHQLPEWLLLVGTLFVFFTELVVPFFIFMGRRMRMLAAAITIFIQLLIIATSNHNWINLLTILLCLFLLDDDVFRRWLPGKWFAAADTADDGQAAAKPFSGILLVSIAAVAMLSSVTAFVDRFTPVAMPGELVRMSAVTRQWGVGHVFHLFPTMQTERHELQIEGSNDGRDWHAYGFRYKPGVLDERPAFIVPHQPRLDWLMWFVPAQHPGMLRWFDRFMARLAEGSPDVLALLSVNPFAQAPPKYLRVQVFRYQFTTPGEREHSGDWWKRTYLGQFPYVEPRRP